MPTVRKDSKGYNVISRHRGRFITHQLLPAGVKLLRDRHENIDELEISRDTFFELMREGCIYTNRQRRRDTGRSDRRQSPVSPRATVKATPAQAATLVPPPAVALVHCQRCGKNAPVGARFCPNCGRAYVDGPDPSPSPAPAHNTAASWIVVVLLLAIVAMIVYLGWMRE